jgi:hypothetical protein
MYRYCQQCGRLEPVSDASKPAEFTSSVCPCCITQHVPRALAFREVCIDLDKSEHLEPVSDISKPATSRIRHLHHDVCAGAV